MQRTGVFAFLFLSLSAFVLNASPLTNGSFEINTGSVGGACSAGAGAFSTPAVGSTCITGWTVATHNIDYINGYWLASNGTHSLDLNGDQGEGAIQQTFDTVSGQLYNVTFSLAGNVDLAGVKTLHVDAAGQSQDYSFDSTGHTSTNMGWLLETFSFTANSANTTLKFSSTTNNNSFGPALDNVAVSAVPEPGTLGLMSVVGGLLIAGRRAFARQV